MTDTTYYAERFKAWQTKLCGPKPSKALLDEVHALGYKPGREALASAMMRRDGGATRPQIEFACDSGMARNKPNRLATNPGWPKQNVTNKNGLLTWVEAPLAKVGGHYAYKFVLSDAGKAKVAAAVKPAKPAKAAKKAKAKLALPAPETPLAPVTAPQA